MLILDHRRGITIPGHYSCPPIVPLPRQRPALLYLLGLQKLPKFAIYAHLLASQVISLVNTPRFHMRFTATIGYTPSMPHPALFSAILTPQR